MELFTLSIKRMFGFVLFFLGMGLVLLPFGSASANWSDPATQYGYSVTRADRSTFVSMDGNKRLELKKLADIDRASAPTVHYDQQAKSNYMCDWSYDKVLGRYVCEKNYLKAYQYVHPKPIPVCPFGYKLDYGGSNCIPIRFPQNARLNSRGDGWECNPGYHLNLTGSVCLGPEHVYSQCPGGSINCISGCQGSACAQPCATKPIVLATPVIVQPIILANPATPVVIQPIIVQPQEIPKSKPAEPSKPPYSLPATGPSFLVTLLGLSGLVARKLLKRA